MQRLLEKVRDRHAVALRVVHCAYAAPCCLLQVASHRLSGQAHYDFGMRNLKSILLIAAQLRANLQVGRRHSHERYLVVVRALLIGGGRGESEGC